MARYDGHDMGLQDGGSQSSRVIDRDASTVSQPSKNGTFLDYNFDVRCLIYEAFFSAEFYGISPLLIVEDPKSHDTNIFWDETRGFGNPITRLTAHHKVSLLLTNRTIFSEASPFFYRFHVFRMKLLDSEKRILTPFARLPLFAQQNLRAITSIELTEQPTTFASTANGNVATYITFLTLACPNLKSLTLDVEMLSPGPGHNYSDVSVALSELWPQLDYLRLRVQHPQYQGWRAHRDLIAPDGRWHKDEDAEGVGSLYSRYGRKLERDVFFIDRARLEVVDDINSDSSGDTSDDGSRTASDYDLPDFDPAEILDIPGGDNLGEILDLPGGDGLGEILDMPGGWGLYGVDVGSTEASNDG